MDPKPNQQKVPAIRTLASDMTLARESGQTELEVKVVETKKETGVVTEKARIEKTPIKPLISSVDKKISDKHKSVATLKPIPKITKIDTESIKESGTSFIVDNEDAATATVITDTKKDRFKLFPSIAESIKQWFRNFKKSKLTKKTPKYSVPETSLRKGIIQKATSNTGKSTTADFSSIQERIKRRQEMATKRKPSMLWSAKTETGFLLLEAPEINTPTNVQITERKSFRTIQQSSPVVAKTPESPTSNPDEVGVLVNSLPATEPEPIEPIPAPETSETNTAFDETFVTETDTETEADEIEPETSDATSSEPEPFSLWTLNTNLLSLVFSGIALVLIAVIALVIIKPDEAREDLPETVDRATLDESKLLEINITDLNALSSNQLSEIKSQGAQTELKLNIETKGLLRQISQNLDLSFIQNIKSVHLGYTKDGNPFMVLAFSDEITTKGGLLMWEKSIYEDFATVFRLDISNTNPTKFVDGRVIGTDVRVLKDEAANDLLLYGYKENLVIITTGVYSYTNLID